MRDSMAEAWKKNGVPEVDFNVLVAGEDTTVDKPTEENPGTDIPTNPNKQSKPGKLPKTGSPVTTDVFVVMGAMTIALGGYIAKKKKKSS